MRPGNAARSASLAAGGAGNEQRGESRRLALAFAATSAAAAVPLGTPDLARRSARDSVHLLGRCVVRTLMPPKCAIICGGGNR